MPKKLRSKSAVQKTREDIARANESLPRAIANLLLDPREFAERVRVARREGRNPQRLIDCLDDIEQELERRGITMTLYFEALRKEARRALAGRMPPKAGEAVG
jgi:hypothetical protein